MSGLQTRVPRLLTPRAAVLLMSFPVVIATGPRQTGKSTLIRDLLGQPDRRYLNLDDIDTLQRAEQESDALFAGDEPGTIDEVQRSPNILLAI